MSILFSNEILDSVKRELQSATTSVQIITAYCKQTTFMRLNSFISEGVKDKRLLVRFRMDDVVKGSTDFSILEDALNDGWKVFIRFDLHAKTYIVDNKRGLIGSANVTNSGFSIGKSGNMEMATLVDVEPHDIDKINKLFDDAIAVDISLVEKLKSQIKTIKSPSDKNNYSWDKSILSLFNPHIETLFSHELSEGSVLRDGEYFAFIDETYSGNVDKLKEKFRWSNAYLWLLDVLKEHDGCLYFGELSKLLHDTMVSDPRPFRKDVKVLLRNLLNLILALDMEDIVIDRPNFSQRVRLKNTTAC